jgi:hypothetical protein
MLRFCVLGLLGLVTVPAVAAETNTLRVYFVGNSVTDTLNYRGLEALAKSLTPEDREAFPMDPRRVVWTDYLTKVHVPAVRREAGGEPASQKDPSTDGP